MENHLGTPPHQAPTPPPQIHCEHADYQGTVDAANLFAALGGTARAHTALLESAHLHTRHQIKSILVVKTALEIQCRGQAVTVTTLTASGTALLPLIAEELAPYLTYASHNVATFNFARALQADEESRLTAPNPAQVLRTVHNLCARLMPAPLGMLLGGFGYDYIDTYEDLEPVGDGANGFPDFQFNLAQHLVIVDHAAQVAQAHAFAVSDDTGAQAQFLDEVARAVADLASDTQAGETEAGETEAGETEAGNASAQLASKAQARESGEGLESGPAAPEAKKAARPAGPECHALPVTASIDDATFRDLVTELQGSIEAGDIYQVVPSRSFTAPCSDPYRAYRELRRTNPSPYMFYLHGPEYTVLGASPESCLKYDATTRKVELYPIAGTRPRGKHDDPGVAAEMDARAELSLRTDAKELAEHIMLVDLARNDLARIGTVGSRKVERLLGVDRYSQVMHLVSHLSAILAPQYDALDAYRACMNMGTLTGAPKISATNLLRRAEKQRRGSYGGAVGYLAADGSFDTCIAIRAAYVADGMASVQAGAGVVRDSDPQAEADETYQKASAVLRALAAAAGCDRVEVER